MNHKRSYARLPSGRQRLCPARGVCCPGCGQVAYNLLITPRGPRCPRCKALSVSPETPTVRSSKTTVGGDAHEVCYTYEDVLQQCEPGRTSVAFEHGRWSVTRLAVGHGVICCPRCGAPVTALYERVADCQLRCLSCRLRERGVR